MDGKGNPITPQKRSNESSEGRFKKRMLDFGASGEDVSCSQRFYKLKILLPNGMTVLLKLPEGTEFITVKELAHRVRKEYERAIKAKKASNPNRDVRWDEELYFLDDCDYSFRNSLKLTQLELNKIFCLRLQDGSQPAEIYENMWDLTPDTELLMELPEEYTFETALADLIDNSLQAVWSNGKKEKRLISVKVTDDMICVVDTGPGMDSMSIEKWGKMGASLHREFKTQAIGGKPPYLKPAFGMFGYGGFVASMHLGKHTEVSSKTRSCKKVYMLRLERDALVSGSGSKRTWKTYGSLRDATKDEFELSPDGSFTKVLDYEHNKTTILDYECNIKKVEIFEPKMRNVDIRRLQYKLKDIYFPYIQCDELSMTGRTTMPIEFQVNGDDLAEIPAGEVAVTNLNSCNGPEFVLQLHFHLNHGNATTTSSPGAKSYQEANARLRCVYLPVKEGKESIESILETLKDDGYGYKEEYGSFSHVSCRRLGRLLPDARWAWLPFMDLRQKKGDKAQILKRSCTRVKCFIETDAGFSPTPYKTDFAHKNPYTTALRNLGSRQSLEKEMDSSTGVHIEIRRDGKLLTLSQLDKQYLEWLVQMHEQYDEEADCGIGEPVFIVNPINKKELHITKNGENPKYDSMWIEVVRVHNGSWRKGKSWKSGQKIKILKGACAGFHRTNIYATLEHIMLEGFQGDAGGEAWIICRPLDTPEEEGCLLKSVDGNPVFDLQKSVSVPISVIDSGKCIAVDDTEWNNQVEKQHQKSPSSIEILSAIECRELGIEVSLPDEAEVYAGHASPSEVVAVVRPAFFKSGTTSKHLDQKYVMKDYFEMTLVITFSANENSQDESNIYSGRVTPSSRGGFHGLYVFQPKCKSHPLFQKAGIYTFTFSIRDSSCQKCLVKLRVNTAREDHIWVLAKKVPHYSLNVGWCRTPISVAMFDKYQNRIPFAKVPEMEVKVKCNKGIMVQVRKWSTSATSDKSVLTLEDLLIESSNLDNVRPSYDATLMLCAPHGQHLLDIPIKVFPGSVERVTMQPENFEKQLVPGYVIKELILEVHSKNLVYRMQLFDAYGNHIREDEKVELSVDGFCFLDRSLSIQKVDDCGCIHLDGLLRVTAGYGKNVSLSVCSEGKIVIRKVWQIEKRQLRISSVMPKTCIAGSQLKNMEFEVVNSKGDVDVSFHDEDKTGQSHTLVLKSQFVGIDESVKYSFRDGRCIVRAVPIPSKKGDFSFVAAHSRYSELQLTVKVCVELPPEMEHVNIKHLSSDETILPLVDLDAPLDSQMDYMSVQHHIPDTNASPLRDLYYDEGIGTDLESCLGFQKDLEDELLSFGLRIGQHEKNIKLLQCDQRETESDLFELQLAKDQVLCIGTYGSRGKNEMREKVECKTDSAAAVVMKLFKEVQHQDYYGLTESILGVVALLGTAPTLELSKVFAEFLGDQMLAVVCKSYKDVRILEAYKRNGKLNREHGLHMFGAELGQSINGRYHVLCIQNIRPCEAGKDVDEKLLLPDPILPNGAAPAGFLGYAVNMINIDVDHHDTKTDSGFGLRETLFYRLFGETQVYESRKHMKNAISCIKDGAVSLDGGIIRGNGALSLGCWEPDIIFPIVATRNQDLPPRATQVLTDYREKKLKLKDITDQLTQEERAHEKALKRFKKRRDMYDKYFTHKQPVVSPITSLKET